MAVTICNRKRCFMEESGSMEILVKQIGQLVFNLLLVLLRMDSQQTCQKNQLNYSIDVDKSEEVLNSAEAKSTEGSVNRDAVLARVETEKRTSLIRAWEESEKSIAENRLKTRECRVEWIML